MKLLSFSILFGSLLISFNYVWINRISVIKYEDKSFVLLNKWTGKHFVFIVDRDNRDFKKPYYDLTLCGVDKNGKVTLP